MQCTLKSLQSQIPNIIRRIESIQEVIDRHHSNVNKATVVGSIAGIVGGGLMIGGFIGAFFTFGASLGLTVVGAGIGTAGGMTTAGARIFDYMQSSDNNQAVRSLLNTVDSLCKKAQNQCKNVETCCGEIGDILAANNLSLHNATTMEKLTLGWNVVSFCRLHKKAGSVGKDLLKAASGTFRLGKTTSPVAIKALTITMKAVGGIFIVLGIIGDVYCLGKSISELIEDARCPISEAISDQLTNLRNLQYGITQFLNSL